MDYRDIITIEPGKRSGNPCIRRMRITVYDILEYLAGGMTQAEILEDFSELTIEDIQACLAFAADRATHLRAWVAQRPQTGITLPDSAFDRETIYD
jgi:uncharacterized protein (DUF433 family)